MNQTMNNPPRRAGAVIIFFGVVLPVFTLLFELVSGFCASMSFDPVPTIWHILLVALIPIANVSAIVALRSNETKHIKVLTRLNGLAIGVSLFYTLAFIPLTPFAIPALAAWGLGLLPLTPLACLVVGLVLRRRLSQLIPAQVPAELPEVVCGDNGGVATPRMFGASNPNSPDEDIRRYNFSANARYVQTKRFELWGPVIAAFAALCLLEMPSAITYAGARIALGTSTQLEGIRLLRDYGNREHLLRYCYRTDRPLSPFRLLDGLLNALNLSGSFKEIEPKQGQMLFYRVTGTPYNTVRPPSTKGLRGNSLGSPADGNEFDFNQGSDVIGGTIKGLSLEQSSIEGSVDAESGTAYTEWTLVFKNDSIVQREARAQITLPPGGVVSRLTLWINDQEREAAYSARSTVKQAYEKIVKKRRDPVLVTTSGRDTVTLQCFPVPPDGGIMKTRIGITAPLTLESPAAGVLRLPFFAERNFSILNNDRHAASIHANSSMSPMLRTSQLRCLPVSNNLHTLQGQIETSDVTTPFSVRCVRPEKAVTAWTEDNFAGEKAIVRQIIIEERIRPQTNAVIVIDGSQRMAEHNAGIAQLIRRLPDNIRFSVIVAGDEVIELCPIQTSTKNLRETIAAKIDATTFEGGCENAPALKRAVEMLDHPAHSVVLWLHAAQPVELSKTDGLFKSIGTEKAPTALYDMQIGSGPDVVSKELEELSWVISIPNFGSTHAILDQAHAIISGTAKTYRFERRRETGTVGNQEGSHTSSDLVRLWAHDEILRSAESLKYLTAIQLAQTYHLVTPVSGAVVLETEEQYKEAGLTPIDDNMGMASGTVPEPETWALALIGAVTILLVHSRRRRHA